MPQGTATIDFGAEPASEASVVVTGQGALTAAKQVGAWVMGSDTTATNDADAHQAAGVLMRLTVSDIVAGVGFTLTGTSLAGAFSGELKTQWAWT